MSKSPRHRRPLIEALEPRLLFSATADIAVFDDGNADGQYLAQAAGQVDLVSIYMSTEPLGTGHSANDLAPQADLPVESTVGITTVIFVDTAVDNYAALVKDINAGLERNSVAIIYLDSTQDGLAQINNYLAGASGISAIHILSHGIAGNVQLGNQVLNESTIGQFKEQIAAWQTALTNDADILFYGCDLAANQSGVDLLRQLSVLTGADIAASNNVTGNSSVNADWVLEEKIGTVETASLFAANQPMEWQGALADVVRLSSGAPTNQQAIPINGDIKQGVQLTSTQAIDRVQISLANYGTASSQIVMKIHQSNYGGPVVATASVATSSIGNSLGVVNFDFAAVNLSAYVIYWVSFATNDRVDNLVSLGYINSDVITSEYVVDNVGTAGRDMSIALIDVQNQPPTLANPIADQAATEDTVFNFSVPANTFNDTDGDTLSYSAELANGSALPSWLNFNASTKTFSGVPTNGDVGTLSVKVIANDGHGATVNDTFDIVIANVNDAPVLDTPVPNQNATEDSAFTYTFPDTTFSDGDVGTTFTYTAELAGGGALPTWLTLDSSTRTFSGTPANGDVGTISIKLTASDGAGGVANDTFDIIIANTNDAPTVANAIPNQVATENALFNFSFAINAFTDMDVGNSLTYSAQLAGGGVLPGWLSFDAATRTFNGTPQNADVGSVAIDVIASDGSGATAMDTFTIVIGAVNDSPYLVTPIPNQNATEDIAFNFQFSDATFDDIDVGDTLIYSATMADDSSLPGWLTFDELTRTFSGTPTNADVGTISIKVVADDGNGGMVASDIFDLVIANTNDAPTIANPIPNQNAQEDSPFNFTFASTVFTDQDVGNTLTYSVQLGGGGALPAWISFDPASRTFSGTPLNANVGTLSIDVIANDGNGGTVTDTFNIIVANTNDAPTIANPIGNQNATEDTAFNFQFAANTFSDQDVGNNLVYSAQMTGGWALPSWLSFDSATRTFSGTPINDDVGTISIDVMASDGNGGTVTDTFSIIIANTNDAPTVLILPTDYAADEQQTIDLHGTGISVTDVDGDALTITIAAAGTNSSIAASVGTTGVVLVSGYNTNTLILTGTAAQLNDLFAGNNGSTLTYRLSGDTPVASRLLTISASDGNLSGSDTAIINITALNDHPENTVPVAQATNEDTALVFSVGNSNQIQINDLDVGAGDLEITLSVTNGTLTLAGVVGLVFTTGDGTADSSLVFRGTQTNINAALATLTFTPTPNYTGTAILSLTTDDLGSNGAGGALTDVDTVNITINSTNDAPTLANPIADQAATEDAAFNFQFAVNTFADSDVGDTLTYTAQLAGGGALPTWLSFDPVTRTFSGIPANGDVGTVSIDVIADDGNGGTITDTFNVVVGNTNDAPIFANPIADQTVTEDAAFNFQFAVNTFADSDVGDTLTYSAQLAGGGVLPSWLSFDPVIRTFSGTPANGDVGTVSIDVIANDGNGGTITDTFNIVVGNINDTPTIANAIPNQAATEDAAFNFQFAANTFADSDVGDTFTYSAQIAGGGALPAWLSFDPVTRTFSGTPANGDVGTVSIDVIADDGNGGTVTDTFNIVVGNINDTPTIANAIPNQTATEDAAFNFQFAVNTFADSDVGDTLTYTAQLAGGGALPTWLSFDPVTRTFSGTPANGDVGTVSIDVIADDGNGGTVTDTFNIVVGNINDTPTIANAIPNQTATEDAAFNFQFAVNTFADSDVGDTLTYTAQLAGGGALPTWLSFDPVIRTFSGTPANGDVGTVSIDVIADDGNGGTITDTFNIVVGNINDTPTIANAIPNQAATEDAAFNFQFAANTFADSDVGDTLTYTAQLVGGGAIPAWLSFDSVTRTFSGTPANSDVGTVSIDVIADDGNGGTITDTFNIVVGNINDTPTIANAIPNQAATEDAAFNFQFVVNTFADSDVGDTLTYTAQLAGGGALPTWLSFDPVIRTFSGTPANGDVGNIAIDVIANDGNGGAVTDTFSIVVASLNDAPVTSGFTPINDIEDAAGATVNLFAAFSDEETAANQLQYFVVSNSNPALVSSAVIDAATGTLQLRYGANQFGSCDLVIRTQDAQGASVETALRINIQAVNDVPTATGIADVRVQAGGAAQQTDLHSVFSDIEDGVLLKYTLLNNSNPAAVTNVHIDPATGVMTLIFASSTGGEALIILRATDSNGAWVDAQYKVTVIPLDMLVPIAPVTPPAAPITEIPVTAPPDTTGDGDVIEAPLLPTNPDEEDTYVPVGGVTDLTNLMPRDDSEHAEFTSANNKSSRDYLRADEFLNKNNVLLTTLTASTSQVSLISLDSGFTPWEAEEFDNEVRRIRAQMDEAMEEEYERKSVVAGLTFSVTTGLLVWSLRASSLLLTMMSMLPLWRGIDPLPILDEVNKKKKELEQQRKDREREDKNKKEVGYMFDHAQNRK